MKISIITPIYNEEKNIDRYFKAIKNLKYDKNDFEIIFINDGSKDNSLKLLQDLKNNNKEINIKIIDLKTNKGRAIAREEGAKNASYDDLLFLDAKCEIFSNALNVIKNKKYSPIVGNALQKQNNLIDKFLYIIRKKLFKSSFGEKFDDIFINKDNFDDVSKGTGILFINRDFFLKSIPKEKGENISDDTKLLKNIIKEKDILKTSDLKIYYNVRDGIIENIVHIYERGPKFIDFYYKKGSKYYNILNILFVSVLLYIFLLSINIKFLLLIPIVIILLGVYFASSIKEFIIFILIAPVLFTAFVAGLMKGLFLKLTGKLGK